MEWTKLLLLPSITTDIYWSGDKLLLEITVISVESWMFPKPLTGDWT
jgi:hypothetical protein